MAVKINITDKYYILNEYKELVRVGQEAWVRWLETHDTWLDEDRLSDGKRILTTFTGLDQPINTGLPLVFETNVFPDENRVDTIEIARYSSWDEAIVGHKRIVEKWKKHSPKLSN